MPPLSTLRPFTLHAPAIGAPAEAGQEEVRLGSGRSATVFRVAHPEHGDVARKVFGSHGIVRLIQLASLGAPNPYMWSGDAILAAQLRRAVLGDLVRVWFGERMRVALPVEARFGDARRTYELDLELIRGRHTRLLHGAGRRDACELGEGRALLSELSIRLRDSGFVGARWQAGHGNPTALANFMRENTPCGRGRWVWIDLESGIPVVVPVNPLVFLSTYLPYAIRNRHPLFDDVDAGRLGRYLRTDRVRLEEALGRSGFRRLVRRARRLVRYQEAWRSMAWIDRGLTYALARGHVTVDEALVFREKPTRWYRYQAGRAAQRIAHAAKALPGRVLDRIRRISLGKVLRAAVGFVVSQQAREELARSFIGHRLDHWVERKQLEPSEEPPLREALDSPSASAYLADFGVHVALKPATKAVQWTILPLGFALGWYGPGILALGLVSLGPISRTIYTFARVVQSRLRGEERPWVALAAGALPFLGNFAYPLQILVSSRDGGDGLARFVLHDAGASLGRRVPVVGGPDTLAEHLGNRAADRVLALVDRLPGSRAR